MYIYYRNLFQSNTFLVVFVCLSVYQCAVPLGAAPRFWHIVTDIIFNTLRQHKNMTLAVVACPKRGRCRMFGSRQLIWNNELTRNTTLAPAHVTASTAPISIQPFAFFSFAVSETQILLLVSFFIFVMCILVVIIVKLM